MQRPLKHIWIRYNFVISTKSQHILGSPHKLLSLDKRKKELTKSYKAFIEEFSGKQTEFSKKQKSTWQKFEDLMTKYDETKKLETVDRLAKQQVK